LKIGKRKIGNTKLAAFEKTQFKNGPERKEQSIKKKRSSAMKMVTAGTMNLSISIRVEEIPYSIGTAYFSEVVFIAPKLVF